jgi:hypothetical protein
MSPAANMELYESSAEISFPQHHIQLSAAYPYAGYAQSVGGTSTVLPVVVLSSRPLALLPTTNYY